MRSAENVLGIIRERGRKGQPLEDSYRQLYNPKLYLLANENLRNNAGVMTPGVTKETVDGMSMKKIQQIIEAVRHERYRWKPVRRTYIPKKSGKLRPLGLPMCRSHCTSKQGTWGLCCGRAGVLLPVFSVARSPESVSRPAVF